MENQIELNGIYKHYKGNLYQVLQIARHTETNEDLIIYRNILNMDKIYAMPYHIWNEEVTLLNGEKIKKFKYFK